MAAKSKPGKERALTKDERRARSLANLKPAQKGEVRNPTGKNGRERSDYVVSVLSEPDKDGVPYIRKVILKQIKRALAGSDPAAKAVIEQFGGKARQLIDLTSSDRSMSPNRKPTTAETRQELDRVMTELGIPPAAADAGGAKDGEVSAEPQGAAAEEPKAGP